MRRFISRCMPASRSVLPPEPLREVGAEEAAPRVGAWKLDMDGALDGIRPRMKGEEDCSREEDGRRMDETDEGDGWTNSNEGSPESAESDSGSEVGTVSNDSRSGDAASPAVARCAP